jgi:hypothetical protein
VANSFGSFTIFGARHRARLAVIATTLLFIAVYGVAIYALWIGIDFGKHWDEPIHYKIVLASYHSGLLLPDIGNGLGFYRYPSMIYWLGLSSVADRLAAIVHAGVRPDVPFEFDFFIMRARTLAMLVSSLGGIWIYLALRSAILCVPALSTAAGGAFYLLSWEFGYHSRWFAPDLICAQFIALFLLFLSRAEQAVEPRRMIRCAAVAIGFATSTKYTAAGALFALWAYVVLQNRLCFGTRVRMIAESVLIAAGAYLIVTPGTVLQPGSFYRDLLYDAHHYATTHGTFLGVEFYDVRGFWKYLNRLWEYLALVMMSPQPSIAAILTMMAAVGLVVTWRNSRALGTALGLLLVFYSVFYSLHVVFQVRNFLLLLPVFAYLAAVGIDFALGYARSLGIPKGRAAATSVMVLALATIVGWNAWAQISFAHSIATARNVPLIQQVAEYLAQHRSVAVELSPSLAAELEHSMRSTAQTDQRRLFIYRESELTSAHWNGAKLTFGPWMHRSVLDWIGPREVNLNYYPHWIGHDHAILMDMNMAKRAGIIAALKASH